MGIKSSSTSQSDCPAQSNRTGWRILLQRMNNEWEWINHDLPFDQTRPLTQRITVNEKVRNNHTGDLFVVSGLWREQVQPWRFVSRLMMIWAQPYVYFRFLLRGLWNQTFLKTSAMYNPEIPSSIYMIFLLCFALWKHIQKIYSSFFHHFEVRQAHLMFFFLFYKSQPLAELDFFSFRLLFFAWHLHSGQAKGEWKDKKKGLART